MKSLKLIYLFLFSISSLIASGNDIDYSKNYNSYKYNFKSVNKNKVFTSEFTVFDSSNTIIYNSKFVNNENLENFKVLNSHKIVEISKNNSLPQELLMIILNNLDNFLESMLIDLSSESENIKQLSFHYSILTIKKREIKSKICECTVHPGYLTDKIGFGCMEDHILNISEITNIIERNSTIFGDTSSKELLRYLKQNNNEIVTFKEVYGFYYPLDKYNDSLESSSNVNGKGKKATSFCLLGSGSDHGCCGNYEGCCYYVNPICHIHDKLCVTCKPRWFCFSGCVPD